MTHCLLCQALLLSGLQSQVAPESFGKVCANTWTLSKPLFKTMVTTSCLAFPRNLNPQCMSPNTTLLL
jgi:hypothetical protein